MSDKKPCIHVSEYGTYHQAPDSCPSWTINDTSGYIDDDPICDNCDCNDPNSVLSSSIMYVCLDGGDCLCPECFEKEYGSDCIVPCDCE